MLSLLLHTLLSVASLDVDIVIDAHGDAVVTERWSEPPGARKLEPGEVNHWFPREARVLSEGTSHSVAGVSVLQFPGNEVRYGIARFADAGRVDFILLRLINPAIDALSVTVRAQDPQLSINLEGETQQQPWRWQGSVPADAFLRLSGTVAGVQPWSAIEVGKAFFPHLLPYAWLVFALLAFTAVSRVLSSRAQVAALHAAHGLAIALLCAMLARSTQDTMSEWRAQRTSADEFVFTVVVYGLLLAFFGGVFALRSVTVFKRTRTAHMAEASTGLLVLPLLFLTGGDPLFALVAVCALAPLLVWTSPRLRLELGGAAEELVARTSVAGQLSVTQLAKELSVTERAIIRILLRERDLPVVYDRSSATVTSAAIASERALYRICQHCGGAALATQQTALRCAYCGHGYGLSRREIRPMQRPTVVALCADSVRAFWFGLALMIAAFGVSVLILDRLIPKQQPFGVGEYVVVAVAAAIFVGTGLWFASGWRLRILLLPVSRRPIVRAYFGKLQIEPELLRRGFWPLRDLASYLRASYEEAVELSRSLAVTTDYAIYDRLNDRLCHRNVYKGTDNACSLCGGIMGPGPRCQHCDTPG